MYEAEHPATTLLELASSSVLRRNTQLAGAHGGLGAGGSTEFVEQVHDVALDSVRLM